jgi:DegV family protein with EDD domain
MSFNIITDSASDLPKSIIEEYNAYVMPTPVLVDEEDFFDGDTILPDEFYRLQKENHDIKTYHISQLMFQEHFQKFAKKGDEVLYICFSTGIAGTYNAARLAVEEIKEIYPEFKITIIDSHCASIGYGLIVYKLLQMQKNQASKELIIEAAKFFCAHMKHAFTVDSLEYLYKGGRISRTSAAVGSALSIKPIIIVDENGALKSVEKEHGWKKALKRIVTKMGEESAVIDKQTIGVCYGTNEEDCDHLAETIMETYHPKHIMKGQIGCAIGAHTGPNIVAVVYLDEINDTYEKYID